MESRNLLVKVLAELKKTTPLRLKCNDKAGAEKPREISLPLVNVITTFIHNSTHAQTGREDSPDQTERPLFD